MNLFKYIFSKKIFSSILLTVILLSSCDKGDPYRAPLRTDIWVVSTFAGSQDAGFADGTGATAKFRNPKGLTIDANGNLYVADAGNNIIRRITPAGEVTTIAGIAGAGSFVDNVRGASARFNNPSGITIGNSGKTLYLADAGNHRIRNVDLTPPNYNVTTFVGTVPTGGGGGFQDASLGTAARFNKPTGIAIDKDNIYIADANNNRIRKAALTGNFAVSTLAGITYTGQPTFMDGAVNVAKFYLPSGLVLDTLGKKLYVADSGNHRIRSLETTGTVNVKTLAGNSANFSDGSLNAATFNGPYGITMVVNALYVADWNNNRIRKISLDQSQEVTTFAGNGTGNSISDGEAFYKATFRNPSSIVIDKQGNFYVADAGNNCIRKITYVKR